MTNLDDCGKKGSPAIGVFAVDLLRSIVAWRSEIQERINHFVTETFGGYEQLQESLNRAAQAARILAIGLPLALEKIEHSVYEDLLEYSWFIDTEMGVDLVIAVANLVERRDEASINQVLSDYFRKNISKIEGRIISRHDTRRRVLVDAFAAHHEGRYGLSIPVFLSQADGISREVLGAEYFSGYDKCKAETERLINELTDELFLTSALRALIPRGASRLHTKVMKKDSLNRHAVLHGFDTSYDTEPNSLKAVSLLNFMSSLSDLKKQSGIAVPPPDKNSGKQSRRKCTERSQISNRLKAMTPSNWEITRDELLKALNQ